MSAIKDKINATAWHEVIDDIAGNGYAVVPNFMSEQNCKVLIDNYENKVGYRKTVTMARHRFGLGEYKYYDYPLPPIIQVLREEIYSRLAPMANGWMNALRIDVSYPKTLNQLHQHCKEHNQLKPTPLILKYGKGGFNTLHQDLYGDVYFPLQVAIFLNEPEVDYTGGEFVLTQQNPRAQSKATVLRPNKGDMLIFPTRYKPVMGARGYHRTTMKHGVSEVTSGERYVMGIIFHDAVS